MMNNLALSEIERKYKDEWVLIGDPELGKGPVVKGGKVLHHSKSRDELHRKALALKPVHSAILYMGELPPDMAVIL